MPYTFDEPVVCPIEGCKKTVSNTGALGTHLRYMHGITDDTFRRKLVDEVKRRAIEGDEPLKMKIDELRDYIKSLENSNVVENRVSVDAGDNDNIRGKTILPSPKVLAVVDQMDYDDYLKDEVDEEEGVMVTKRRMSVSVRPISVTLSPEVFIYYDWVRSMGYKKSLSEFINDAVKQLFRDRGIGIGVVVINE